MTMVLSLIMCLGLAMPTWAAEEVSYEEKTVEVNGYSFDILEKVNNYDCTVVRTYENPDFSSKEANINDVDEAKALLIALGMDEENLDLWSDQSILDFANGESITVGAAYYKVNNNDNSATKVPVLLSVVRLLRLQRNN